MSDTSRRNFLAAAGLVLPAAGMATTTSAPTAAAPPAPAADELRFRTLGRTGLKVTTVGFGCMITQDPSVITRAADMGINYFDSSRWYQQGNNEKMVGAALGKKRKDIVLSSKVDARDKAGALKELDMSLAELGTDHLDIWYLHGKNVPDQITDELIEAQEIGKKAGKVRFIGVSTHRVSAIADFVVKQGKMDVVLGTFNFTMDPSMAAAMETLHKANVGTVAMKVMAGGSRGRNPNPRFKQPKAGLAALKWVIKNPNICTTVPSMTDMDQLEENFRAMAEDFTDADHKILTARLEEIRPVYCRMCGQCDGKCPQGLPVADVLRYLMYAENYGQFSLGREHFQKLEPAAAAVRCNACPECTIRCPNGVHVTQRLIRAQELFA